jgi:hypothetical protein
MRVGRLLSTLCGITFLNSFSQAQFLPPSPVGPTGNNPAIKGVSVSRSLPSKKIVVFVAGSVSRGYLSPYGFYSPFGFGSSFTVGTIWPVTPPPTIVIMQPPPRADRGEMEPEAAPREREAPKQAPPPKPMDPFERVDKPLPGMPAGGFRPIMPEDRVQPLMPRAEDDLKPRDKPEGEAVRNFDPFRYGIPLPPAPETNPAAEKKRLTKLANQAFADQHYGLAAERYRQALAMVPDDGETHFLLAQAYFSLGKFRESVDAIETGLRWQKDWPRWDFKPPFLYGGNEEDFKEDMQRLDEALARHPNDPVLLFLKAYQLWFDGRRAEAGPLLRHAAAVGSDITAIQIFLNAQP